MATRQNTVLLKRSNVIGKIPPLSGLTLGEMALNTADAKLYSLYTSGTTGATEVRQIGWDRISRTGDTVTGDFNIFGDVAISGSSLPNGYALTVTGDTDILGDLYVEGDIDYDGNLIVSGSAVFQSGITANTIYTDYIDFNTGATVAQSVGRINWDSGTGTLNIAVGDSGTGLIDLQVGQEEIVRVYNAEATTLVKGEIVYVSGSQGNRPAVKRAVATSDGYSVTTLGMVDVDITSGSEGYVTTFGIISNLNTSGLTGGTPIWLSGTVPGGYTSTKPIAPEHTVLIGYVVRVSATVGSIFVNISNGWELDEIHDVRISGVTEGDLLMRSSYSGTPVWVNTKTLLGSYAITGNTNIGGNLTVSGTTFLKGLSATTISATTIGVSGDCIDDIYVSNIHSCSPLNINPLDEGNVYFGSTSGVTIDLTNNRLGIGTSLPQETLHISGTSRFDNDVTIWDDGVFNGSSRKLYFRGLGQTGNTQTGEIVLDAFGGTNKEYLQLRAGGVRFIANDVDGAIQFFNLASNNPKIQSVQSGGLSFEVNSTTNGFTFGQGYSQTTGDLFSIYNSGPTKAFSILASNSNVGIGDITPTAKLHINNTTSGNTFLAEDSTNPDSSPFVIDASGNTGLGVTTPTAKLQVKVNDFDPVNFGFAVSDSGNTDNYFTVNNVGQAAIRTPYTGSNNQFLIRNTNFAAGEVRFNVSGDYGFSILDNQGYGFTSNPSSININTRATSGLINIWTQAGNTTTLGLGGQDINPTVARTRTIIRPVNSTTVAFTPSAGTAIDYSFENGGNTAFQPTGGTATYTQIQLRPTYNTTGSYSGTVRGLYYNPILTSLSGATHRAIETTTGDVLLNTTSGNVGIGLTGTTSPTAKLHINNTTSGNTFLAEDSTNPDSSPFVIDASGNTGIGTLTPQAKLDVVGGDVALNGNRLFLGTYLGNQVLRNVETTNLQLFNSVGVLYLNASDRVIFGSNNSTSGRWATFFNTGNLLIQSGGTHTDAGFKLDVIGNTRVSGDTIISSGLSASTVTITTTPVLNNNLEQILGRTGSTGDVQYREINTLGNNYTYVSGATYSALTTDNVLGVDSSISATTIYLPDSVSSGRLRYDIKDIGLNSFNNNITIVSAGSDTIISTENSNTVILESDGGALVIFNTGTGTWLQM